MNTKNMLEQALRCYALGFSIIPVDRAKKPLVAWKSYQKERATPEQIKTWFEQFPNMNIGVVTGAISGIVVIDVEKEGSIESLPTTITVKTGGGGWHRYYKYPNKPISNSVKKIAPFTDIRADGGYVVLPPSIHASGNGYEWLTPPENGFRDIPSELLQKITDNSSVDIGTIENGYVLEGMRNDYATKYIGRVLHHLPADLWETAGWASLKDWNNTRAKPPLSDGELRNVFTSIVQRENNQRNVKDSAEQINFTPFTLTNLYQEEFPAGRWVVQDLIPFGTITALTGDSNSYKTFLSQSMAASVVSGELFLRQFATTKGKVLYIDEENHRKHVQERFKSLGVNATSDILFLSLQGVKIDNEKHVNSLLELLEKEKPTLVIFDSLVRLHNGEENSATEIARAFSGMRKLISDDRAILVIHHHRKLQGFGRKNGSQNIRGSSDILASVDSHLAVDRKETELTIAQTKMRIQPEIKPFKVSLVPTLDGVSFAYQGEDTSEDDRLQEAYEEIKTALKESIEPLTVDILADETNLPYARLRQSLKDLVKSKEIVITGRGAHGVHFYGLQSV